VKIVDFVKIFNFAIALQVGSFDHHFAKIAVYSFGSSNDIPGELPDKIHTFDHASQLCLACAAKHPYMLPDGILSAFTDVHAAAARRKILRGTKPSLIVC
jgi:hypothetical protein